MLVEALSEVVTDISAVLPEHYWLLLPASPQGAWPGETGVGKSRWSVQSNRVGLVLLSWIVTCVEISVHKFFLMRFLGE